MMLHNWSIVHHEYLHVKFPRENFIRWSMRPSDKRIKNHDTQNKFWSLERVSNFTCYYQESFAGCFSVVKMRLLPTSTCLSLA